MKIAIVSYSYTGNNNLLAAKVAEGLSARHIAVKPKKSTTMGTIVWNMLFNWTPKVQPAPETLAAYDAVVLVGPVWMGAVATPLRAYLRWLKKNGRPYGFLSISGGADSDNPKLANELYKATGRKPAVLLDQHIRTLLPAEPIPTRAITSAYKLTQADTDRLADAAVRAVRKAWA